MIRNANTVLGRALLILALAGAAVAQEKPKPPAPPASLPPLPQPGPEHVLLKNDAGVWDATVEMNAPGQPTAVSKGVETNTLVGGMWLVTDFQSTLLGQPFQGHGVAGYDPGKKKYVSSWVDSMSTGMSIGESTYDHATKTMTGWMEGPDHLDGKITKTRAVSVWLDANTRTFTMYNAAPDGKEYPSLKITYKRRQ